MQHLAADQPGLVLELVSEGLGVVVDAVLLGLVDCLGLAVTLLPKELAEAECCPQEAASYRQGEQCGDEDGQGHGDHWNRATA